MRMILNGNGEKYHVKVLPNKHDSEFLVGSNRGLNGVCSTLSGHRDPLSHVILVRQWLCGTRITVIKCVYFPGKRCVFPRYFREISMIHCLM